MSTMLQFQKQGALGIYYAEVDGGRKESAAVNPLPDGTYSWAAAVWSENTEGDRRICKTKGMATSREEAERNARSGLEAVRAKFLSEES